MTAEDRDYQRTHPWLTFDVTRQLAARNALLVAGDEVYRHEPFLQRQFAVFENRIKAYAEFQGAFFLAALVCAVRQVIDVHGTAMRASHTVRPTDSAEMINAFLLIREDLHHTEQGIEFLEHVCRRFCSVQLH